MKFNIHFTAVVLAILITSCARIYKSPELEANVASHRIVAIAPPKVSIPAQKKVDAAALKEQQKTESNNFHQEISNWMLKRKMQGRISVNVLDIETTQVKLQKAGHYGSNPLTPDEICDLLEVDAIITSNFALSKPMSEGGAIALGLLVGVWGSTNEADVTLGIYDRKTKSVIWNFEHTVSGSVGSSPARLVENLMSYASRKLPYRTKEN